METVGLVLAGGLSSRMGQDKAWLRWNGEPLFLHMRGVLAEAGADHILISGDQCGTDALADRIPRRGPLGGIHTALAKVDDGQLLLVVPVDMPKLTPELCRSMVDVAQQRSCLIACLSFTLPMVLPVSARLRAQVERQMASDNQRDYSLRRLFSEMSGIEIPVPTHAVGCMANINTLDEWRLINELEAP